MKKLFTVFFLLLSVSSFAKIIYANKNASGANDGSSWANAFTNMQYPLLVAQPGDTIWVAKGTYYPDEGQGFQDNNRQHSFALKNNVAVYGGFAGTETLLSQRNWNTNVTILSGDLMQNDGAGFANYGDNSYNVFKNTNLNNTAVLDGFTITAGNADILRIGGGGMYNNNASPAIAHCIFTGNLSVLAGAMLNYNNSSPILTNCSISANKAKHGGGIQNNDGSSPVMTNCILVGNTAEEIGGAILNGTSSPVLTNCIFRNNTASMGGALCNFSRSAPIVTNCSFQGNSATTADGTGGILNNYSSAVIVNCIVWDNSNGEIANTGDDNNKVSFSIVKGGFAGEGNLDANPLFVNTAMGDLHLQACSPAINKGSSANVPSTDLDGNPRPVLGAYDIGAYEFQAPAVGGIVYVNAAAAGTNDGSSWINAYTKLQDAFTKVRTCHDLTQIWVAKGTYYPDEGVGISNNDRNATFLLVSNVRIYGGFTGNETTPEQRNWKLNPTVLSGDIAQDDEVTDGTMKNNTISVVQSDGIDKPAILDGFVIVKGYNDGGLIAVNGGGGAYFQSSLVNVANCNFKNNYSWNQGGGIFVYRGNVTVTNCLFSDNESQQGGGITVFSATAHITNCTFSGNMGVQAPGGIMVYDANATIGNCILWNNRTTAFNDIYDIWNYDGYNTLNLSNCIIKSSGGYSGGTNISHADPLFVNEEARDFRLQACSPAIDAGLNNLNSQSFDLGRNTRINNNIIDLGAYEYSGTLYTFYPDADNDNYGSAQSEAVRVSFCPTKKTGEATNNTDCNDANAAVNPGAAEICGNGIDDNCNGQVDEDCAVCGTITNMTTTNITSNAAQFNWVSVISPEQWELEYKTIAQGGKWKPITLAGTLRSTTVTGLDANQRYQWHIRAKCNKTWMPFTDVLQFITLKKGQAPANSNYKETITAIAPVINLYPNPASGPVTIELRVDAAMNGTAKLEVLNGMGQPVAAENVMVSNGVIRKQLTLSSSLGSGIYLVRITVRDQVYQVKMVYQK